ncbi:MAG TPA: T9SS C-terminal target domain-containing protein, partial [Flavobacterium sp.]|nr:T9SS C-terminal target domain-containing protein [Flavobacterium sp.]
MRKLYLFVAIVFSINSYSQIINFADANFKAKLLTASVSNSVAKNSAGNNMVIDANGNGQIEVGEALNVYQLNVGYSSILSLVGIQNFANLRSLECIQNGITTLDVSGMSNLLSVKCNFNNLTSINLTGLSNLEVLSVAGNDLTSIDLNSYPSLHEVIVAHNFLTSLNVSNLINLISLKCNGNPLTTLDVSNLVNLEYLMISESNISSIDLSNQVILEELYMDFCPISSIDLSNLINLTKFTALSDPNITSLDFSNNLQLTLIRVGASITTLDVSHLTQLTTLTALVCPNLQTIYCKNGSNENLGISANDTSLLYICGDEGDITHIQNKINTSNLAAQCHVNSYCSYSPGGEFYTINGTTHFDETNNGCEATDVLFPNINLAFTNGTSSAGLIANTSGNYFYDVQAGTQTIVPSVENPTYFNISPSIVDVTFPTQASPFQQDFCVTANGVHPDLEVVILGGTTRPGMAAYFQVVCRNKGNMVQNGTLNFTYDNTRMGFLTSEPASATQTPGSISWDFADLAPFETDVYEVSFQINTPTDTPPVNGNDILSFAAMATPTAGDESIADNSFTLDEVVVNSYDPNEITCLEGTTVGPETAGNYVHYVIRFENLGTAEALNVVVRDMIDAAKFEIGSLVPLHASHEFVTNITGNKAEFIFENINLPFDDANNDGYVAFKIKTKPTLV